jgi:hypothetical protein
LDAICHFMVVRSRNLLHVGLLVIGIGGILVPPVHAQDVDTASADVLSLRGNPYLTLPTDVRTEDDMATFMTILCDKVRAGDADWVKAHVRLPLPGNELIKGDEDDPILGGRLTTNDANDIAQVAGAAVCEEQSFDVHDFKAIAIEGTETTGIVKVGKYEYRLVFQNSHCAPRIVECSFELPAAAKGCSPKKVRGFFIEGRVIKDHGDVGRFIDVIVRRALHRPPPRVRRFLSHNNICGTTDVLASKEYGKDARVRVYASSAVPASLLSCIETRLNREIQATFYDSAFIVEYLLKVVVPTEKRKDGLPCVVAGDISNEARPDGSTSHVPTIAPGKVQRCP